MWRKADLKGSSGLLSIRRRIRAPRASAPAYDTMFFGSFPRFPKASGLLLSCRLGIGRALVLVALPAFVGPACR